MVIVNNAKHQINLFIGGSITTAPTYFIIGTGSSSVSVTDTTLNTASDRQAVTTTTFPATQKVTWQGDWNSAEISGTQLKEFGMILSGTGLTGSIWSRTGMPNLIFDGTNELRIEETWEVF